MEIGHRFIQPILVNTLCSLSLFGVLAISIVICKVVLWTVLMSHFVINQDLTNNQDQFYEQTKPKINTQHFSLASSDHKIPENTIKYPQNLYRTDHHIVIIIQLYTNKSIYIYIYLYMYIYLQVLLCCCFVVLLCCQRLITYPWISPPMKFSDGLFHWFPTIPALAGFSLDFALIWPMNIPWRSLPQMSTRNLSGGLETSEGTKIVRQKWIIPWSCCFATNRETWKQGNKAQQKLPPHDAEFKANSNRNRRPKTSYFMIFTNFLWLPWTDQEYLQPKCNIFPTYTCSCIHVYM